MSNHQSCEHHSANQLVKGNPSSPYESLCDAHTSFVLWESANKQRICLTNNSAIVNQCINFPVKMESDI